MKLFVHKTLTDHRGRIIESGDGEDKKNASLGEMCVMALLAEMQSDANSDFKAKMHKWNLARQIEKAMEDKGEESFVEFPIEDMDLIKKRVGMYFPTKFVGPVANALENSAPKAVKMGKKKNEEPAVDFR